MKRTQSKAVKPARKGAVKVAPGITFTPFSESQLAILNKWAKQRNPRAARANKGAEFMSLLPKWLKRSLCTHEAYLENMQEWFDLDGNRHITVVCNKCGHKMTADYGLLLPVKWLRHPKDVAARATTKGAE